MLINKSQLFRQDADEKLVELYLQNATVIDTYTLFDKDIQIGTSKWWMEWLQKTISAATLQKVIDSTMEKGHLTSTPLFVYDNLTNDERERFYKRVLGLHDGQSINLASLHPHVAEHIANGATSEAYSALIDDLNNVSGTGINSGDTPWEKLYRLIAKLPMTERMEEDFHALTWQLRQILRTEKTTPAIQSQTILNITNDLFYERLWENGSADIVRDVHDDFLNEMNIERLSSTSPFALERLYSNYLMYLSKALVNPKVDNGTRARMFDDLLSEKYGKVRNTLLASMLRSNLLPDRCIHRVVELACNTFPDGHEARSFLTAGQQEEMTIFLKDERLHENERMQLMRYCQSISPAYKFSSDADHDGLKFEIASALDKYTDGLFGASQNEIAAIFNSDDYTAISKKKECLTKYDNQLSALINSGLLEDSAMDHLVSVLVQSRVPSIIAMMAKNKNLPASSLMTAHEVSKKFSTEKMTEYGFISAMTALLTVYLNQHTPPAPIIRENIMRFIGGPELGAHHFGKSSFNLDTPTSMYSLIATMEYQSGDAFKMLDALFQRKLKKDDAEAVVNLAMTREIYPAILKGDDLELTKTANLLALAVQNCQIDEFDIKLLARINNPAQFHELANELLSNPDFSQRHLQASEMLMAEVLKRKVDSCSVPTMGIHRQRTAL